MLLIFLWRASSRANHGCVVVAATVVHVLLLYHSMLKMIARLCWNCCVLSLYEFWIYFCSNILQETKTSWTCSPLLSLFSFFNMVFVPCLTHPTSSPILDYYSISSGLEFLSRSPDSLYHHTCIPLTSSTTRKSWRYSMCDIFSLVWVQKIAAECERSVAEIRSSTNLLIDFNGWLYYNGAASC